MAGSGYNQDTNQLTPSLYRVGITMTSSSNYPVATANTASGGVWPYDWTNTVYTNATSLSAAQALVLAQGNIRWQRIVDNLNAISSCRILNVAITAANGSTLTTDATNQPTAINFTVEFDRDSFILGEWNLYLKSQGKSSSGTFTNADGVTGNTAYVGIGGSAITTTALAVQDIVCEAILTGGSAGYKRTYRVYSPAAAGDSQQSVTITYPNSSASTIFGTISATQISGTTLAGSPV
jgi:hypothetical protein